MPPALPVVRVVGRGRDTGKTWFASRLIETFTGRGYKVMAVKRSHHPATPDRPGSDTDRFAAAGAHAVVFAGADGVLERGGPTDTLETVVDRYAGRADLAVVEGFSSDTLGASVHLDGAIGGAARFETMDGREILTADVDDVAAFAGAIEREFLLSAAGTPLLRAELRRAAAMHGHLCPGVVLGVRMALAGLERLGLEHPAPRHALAVTVETARCITDAIASTLRLGPGSGHFRVVDHGKSAATFEHLASGEAVRLSACESAREPVACWAPPALAPQHRQAIAYRVMPARDLFRAESVRVRPWLPAGRARRPCARCGESTQVTRMERASGGPLLCASCTGAGGYLLHRAPMPGFAPPLPETEAAGS